MVLRDLVDLGFATQDMPERKEIPLTEDERLGRAPLKYVSTRRHYVYELTHGGSAIGRHLCRVHDIIEWHFEQERKYAGSQADLELIEAYIGSLPEKQR